MVSISHHITPLVLIASGAGTHTHTHPRTHARTHARTHTHTHTFVNKAILRNQVRASLWPAHAWFKNYEFKKGITAKGKELNKNHAPAVANLSKSYYGKLIS